MLKAYQDAFHKHKPAFASCILPLIVEESVPNPANTFEVPMFSHTKPQVGQSTPDSANFLPIIGRFQVTE